MISELPVMVAFWLPEGFFQTEAHVYLAFCPACFGGKPKGRTKKQPRNWRVPFDKTQQKGGRYSGKEARRTHGREIGMDRLVLSYKTQGHVNHSTWLWIKTNGIPFWGRCTTHFRTYFRGDWDVHWGYGILTHGHVALV